MDELVQSIKDNGLLQPLIVRKKNDDYELILGHRRKRALEILGFNDVPVTVLDISDNEADLMMVDSKSINCKDKEINVESTLRKGGLCL